MKARIVIAISIVAAAALAGPVAGQPGPSRADAGTPALSAGGGGMLPGGDGGRYVWSDPPNLEGLIATSEVIGAFGLESEIANDFLLEADNIITLARWWGGYYNYAPGDPLITTANIRFYDDAGCIPGTEMLEVIIPNNANETFVYNQGGLYPIYVYQEPMRFCVLGGQLYWFSVQAGDHPFPPQWGRLAATGIQLCDATFRSAFFSYPDWTPGIDVFGQAFDASQEFESDGTIVTCCSPDGVCRMTTYVDCMEHDWIIWDACDCSTDPCPEPTGACCLSDGSCLFTSVPFCTEYEGRYVGDGTSCEPDPCHPTPAKEGSLGRIRALYR